MGVSNYDKGASAKRYESKYTLSTTKGVAKLLRDYHTLRSRAYERGDMAAIDIIVDLQTALKVAGLTDRQRESITYYYLQDRDQEETAKRMKCDISTESRHRRAALERITAVYIKWQYN